METHNAARARGACGYSYERQRGEDHVDRDQREALERDRLAVAGDLPHRERGQQQRADVDRRERERQLVREQQRDQHQHRVQERRDLRDGVLDDRDREVGLALGGEHDRRRRSRPRCRRSRRSTRPANASETPSASIVGRSAATNQSDTNAAPSAADRQQRRPRAPNGDARPVLVARARRLVAAQVRDHPGDVDEQQRDGADRRELALVLWRPGRATRARSRRSR